MPSKGLVKKKQQQEQQQKQNMVAWIQLFLAILPYVNFSKYALSIFPIEWDLFISLVQK